MDVFDQIASKLDNYAVVAIQKDEPNVEEWAKWHLDVCGFTHVFLFNDQDDPVPLPSCLDKKVVQKSAPYETAITIPKQFFCYNFFLKALSKDFRAVLFIDLDEYLNLHGVKIDKWLADQPQAICHAFNWVFFGSRADEIDESRPLHTFRWRAREANKHVKLLVDLKLLRINNQISSVFLNPHCLHDMCTKQILPSANVLNHEFTGPYAFEEIDSSKYAYIAHYYARSKEQFQKKIFRGRVDAFSTSSCQYYKREDEMWAERARCDLNEVYDEEMSKAMEKL